MNGKLFIVATPIGNLGDLSSRALATLREVDLIACEDTRHTLKLLRYYEVQKPLLSLHEHNEAARIPQLLEKIRAGQKVALVSDAGTPLVSDPGYRFLQAALAERVEIEALPGPCAAINALVLSGLPSDRFFFAGFLTPKSAARLRSLETLRDLQATLIFYESPHRIQKFLRDAYRVLGPRRLVLAREMTKIYEEIYRGRLLEDPAAIPLRSWKGEFVVLVSGA